MLMCSFSSITPTNILATSWCWLFSFIYWLMFSTYAISDYFSQDYAFIIFISMQRWEFSWWVFDIIEILRGSIFHLGNISSILITASFSADYFLSIRDYFIDVPCAVAISLMWSWNAHFIDAGREVSLPFIFSARGRYRRDEDADERWCWLLCAISITWLRQLMPLMMKM